MRIIREDYPGYDVFNYAEKWHKELLFKNLKSKIVYTHISPIMNDLRVWFITWPWDKSPKIEIWYIECNLGFSKDFSSQQRESLHSKLMLLRIWQQLVRKFSCYIEMNFNDMQSETWLRVISTIFVLRIGPFRDCGGLESPMIWCAGNQRSLVSWEE